ncbi:DegT/DnrJ/EryC1/StrS family aminotransferase [Aquiflexum sp.]|uniref:DegT/DnrJ/EryC1/StrS family aminotransferase n=1 Tax=Aquiflexum sp. TaxID=1872584 RepID=UPI0035932576
MNKPIPFLDLSQIPPDLKNALKEKFSQMLEKGIFSGGEEISQFESNLRDFLKVPFAIACSNGTDALELALRTLGIGPGDEVIVPALTWVSTAEAVFIMGARPIFADTDHNGLIDLGKLDALFTQKTKAIIPVHLYGKMVDMEKLLEWSRPKIILIIEDAAQAFGAFQNGISAGTWGDVGCFSFYPTKNLGALGEAGALVTKDESIQIRLKQMINHGQAARDKHLSIGRNARIDSLQAGFMNVKMDYFQAWQKKRKLLSSIYLENLIDVGDLSLPLDILRPNHNAHLFVIKTGKRDKLKTYLKSKGIGTAIHYPTILPKMLPYQDGKEYPIAEKLSMQVLSLPLNPWMNDEDVLSISYEIKRFFEKA